MTSMRHATILVAATLALGCVGPPPPGTTDTVTLEHDQTGMVYDIEVFTPRALDRTDGATVVYAFDGPENAPALLAEYARALDDGAEPVVLVLFPGTNRFDDYTPTKNVQGRGGGQADFIDFIVEEVAPAVEQGGAGGAPDRRVVYGIVFRTGYSTSLVVIERAHVAIGWTARWGAGRTR